MSGSGGIRCARRGPPLDQESNATYITGLAHVFAGKVIRLAACRSYGVLLWEILTYGETPLEEMEVQEVVTAVQKKRLQHTL